MIRLSAAALLTLLVALPAFGQQANPAAPAPGNPGGMPPGTKESAPGTPARGQINQADRTFMHAAAIGGLAEVAAAKLAAEKGTSRDVREFAERMIRDHGAANDRLTALARANQFALPDRLDDEHNAMATRLQQASGAQFDRVYIDGQISDHQRTAQLLQYVIGSGENADLKKFASDILPVVFDHLRMAQTILAAISQQASSPAK